LAEFRQNCHHAAATLPSHVMAWDVMHAVQGTHRAGGRELPVVTDSIFKSQPPAETAVECARTNIEPSSEKRKRKRLGVSLLPPLVGRVKAAAIG
jgi:hypothetical protein